jgi:hypothetical protein
MTEGIDRGQEQRASPIELRAGDVGDRSKVIEIDPMPEPGEKDRRYYGETKPFAPCQV